MSKTFWITSDQLDDEQRNAVEHIPDTTSFLIKGPAGSGKTNILLLRAKYLNYRKLTDFKIIVFTSSLKEFIVEGCVLYGVDPNSAITQRSFFTNILDEHGVPYELVDDFEADRDMLAGKVKSLVDAGKVSQNHCATLLVDEAQDYSDTELLVFRALTKNLVLAADSRQSIYKTTHTPNLLETLVNNNVVELKFHYRSGFSLCKVADSILADSKAYPKVHGDSKYPEHEQPSSVVPIACEDFNEQIEKIIFNLGEQMDLYPDEKIGVLFPKRDQVKEFQHLLASTTLPIDRIRVDTLHSAKGWEFRAVHLGGCEALSRMGPVQKRLIYTGVLRGKTSVKIYYSGHLPGYLGAALAVISPPTPAPSLDELMKGIT